MDDARRPAPSDDPAQILRDWYQHQYSQITATADGSFFHLYMHRAMERHFTAQDNFDRVLEVGGNRGEHIPFVRHAFAEYTLTDLRPPQLPPELASDPRIRTAACDVTDISYQSDSFDRLIATCLLHHVESPLLAAREMRRVTKPGGAITILLPTDPGFAYRAGKALTSGRAARRAGISRQHRLIAALDHRNHFVSIIEQLRHAFREDQMSVDWLPWRVPFMSLNAFTVVNVSVARP